MIDLAYQDGDGIHIIDYKTDAAIGEHNLPHYRAQLAAYVEMMRQATGQRKIRPAVLHLSPTSATLVNVGT